MQSVQPAGQAREAGDDGARGQPVMQRVETALTPILAGDGYDLVLVEYAARSKVLRLYIDHARGITLDDCSHVSRLVGDVLDAEGLIDGQGGIDGAYTLEVSSPGLDRPLVKPAHFQRFVGRMVQVSTRQALASGGRRRVTGELVSATGDGICVAIEDEQVAIAYASIDRARLVPEL